MRTTVDIPDALFERVRCYVAERGMTFRTLVVDCLEREISVDPPPFRLRDASAGYRSDPAHPVSSEAINGAIDDLRQPGWRA